LALGGVQARAGCDHEDNSIDARIKKLLASAPVWLFMKGSPEDPRCGCSRRVVQALQHEGIDFRTFDILQVSVEPHISRWRLDLSEL
jgi:glutaredoxin-related protein